MTTHARALKAVPPLPSDSPPALRSGMVPRSRLVRPLTTRRDTPVALLVAPAGYGKTTVLAEWAQRDERPFRWVWRAADALPLLEAASAPQVIVVDDAHDADPEVLRRIAATAARLPRGVTVALAGRHCRGLPAGRLRAHRLVVEITRQELAMTRLETAMLLDGAGLRLDGEQVDRLRARTEGWPAALYLAAVSIAEQGDDGDAIAALTGADRLLADYLRSDVLAGLGDDRLAFLRRTAILDRLSGPLCDAVLETTGSAAVLDDLARGGVPIEPLDRRDTEFRLHPLLAAMLRAELARAEPELEPELHRRAAGWHAAHGDPERALPHAVAARDRERAAALLWAAAPGCLLRGRTDDLARWLEPLGAAELAARPELALAAAARHLAEGRRDQAEPALAAAERALGADNPDVALLRACSGAGGARRMADDAALAAGPETGRRALAQWLEGVARHLTGDRDGARAALESGAAARVRVVAALCHAQLALLALETDLRDDASRHAEAAVAADAAVRPARALIHAASAVVAAETGDVARARADAAEARRALAACEDPPAWLAAEANAWLARAAIRLSDGPAARALLARAARAQAQVADAPELARWIHDGWERADAFAASATGDGPALTNAELRVLRLLPSHMSMREIAERLNVSTNTIKTQTLAVYRKLDVSSRSQAVARGLTAGLI